MAQFRTEFAVDNKWYTNALRFDTADEAVAEATSRFMVWTVPVAWRVVTDNTPEKQDYTGSRSGVEDPTSFKVTDAAGVHLRGGRAT